MTKTINKGRTDEFLAGMRYAASLFESINPASDMERQHGDPGAGAMGAVLEFRDLIRADADGLSVPLPKASPPYVGGSLSIARGTTCPATTKSTVGACVDLVRAGTAVPGCSICAALALQSISVGE